MTSERITILAIESSCDDTSVSILRDGTILSNCTATQEVHKTYGGVIPELASREHDANIIPVVDAALKQSGVLKEDLSAVAVTCGPGLLGSLMVGVSFAKAYALSLDIPLIDVHHMQAHVAAHYIADEKPQFPFLCLTVSGGHTQIVLVEDFLSMTVLGSTLDDAAGEAFDKAGKMMGLPYPAGPEIDRLAARGRPIFSFSKAKVDGLNFSFSGLKTAFRYFLRDEVANDESFIENNLPDICCSLQTNIVETLLGQLSVAAENHDINHIGIAGGVAANSHLRSQLKELASEKSWKVYIPKFSYCTDNAAMIAMVAYLKYPSKAFADQGLKPQARLQW